MRLYFNVPLMRRFCNVPGEILRISRTSADLSQGLGEVFVICVLSLVGVSWVPGSGSSFPGVFQGSLFFLIFV